VHDPSDDRGNVVVITKRSPYSQRKLDCFRVEIILDFSLLSESCPIPIGAGINKVHLSFITVSVVAVVNVDFPEIKAAQVSPIDPML
jgi:hypothetical protein